jgi:hypothetical protein
MVRDAAEPRRRELGAKEMRYVCLTCGVLRDDGDNCAVAPFGRQDCRWYRGRPVPGARRHVSMLLLSSVILAASAAAPDMGDVPTDELGRCDWATVISEWPILLMLSEPDGKPHWLFDRAEDPSGHFTPQDCPEGMLHPPSVHH